MWGALVDGLSAVVVAVNLVASLTFVTVFAREPWRKTWFGQSVMILAIAVLIFSTLGLLAQWWPNYPLRDEARLLGRLLVSVAILQRLVVLIRLRRRDHQPS